LRSWPAQKAGPFAGDHHHAHRLVACDLVDRGDQRLEHLERERVELLRTVQREGGHAAGILAAQDGGFGCGIGAEFGVHGSLLVVSCSQGHVATGGNVNVNKRATPALRAALRPSRFVAPCVRV